MEEKEKKPWRPPEAAHLPDPIAFAMQGFERFGLPKERLIPPLQTFDRVMIYRLRVSQRIFHRNVKMPQSDC